ncbi:hypothetical protein G6F55_012904 [Rhizopus delemar]|uniref:Uncharacterized protein n=3 Tax=Rhizopus TaxID=4842 RepID=I1C1K9_RHIO9|nr:hypothetical protein RO3G_07044 [Rhizopus delemar RA 99-880]KAG1442677.1 hypothetical protein G6F55_012904 [Rhizopus delemar]KAG1534182.1 hypothetical protein G6F51_012241 [Rhizopus arrhizus]KAG1488797.1 hypothetical protein G6F54_011875 [Rhizopus delemar]KAG1498727.1 hypothetical protein G6F53_011678 [Rhizopus delemar]|eukprot:EIE82339.1 hypothetical protein RO3G_07044 [Rhizopus delemar RA 99-880]
MVLSLNIVKPPDQVHQQPAVTRECLLHPYSSAIFRPPSSTVDLHTTAPNVTFDIEELRISACNDGLRFDNGLVVIRPVVACRPGSVIKRITLQRLPWLSPQRLLEELWSTLGNYGSIRDVGIVNYSGTGAFLGSGYVVVVFDS